VFAGAVPGTELVNVRSRIAQARATINGTDIIASLARRLSDRERRVSAACHELWLKGEWLAGRI
jgi:hypothetical protein